MKSCNRVIVSMLLLMAGCSTEPPGPSDIPIIGPPPGPMLTLTVLQSGGMGMSWSSVPGVISYHVLRTIAGTQSMVATISGSTSYADADIVAGYVYCYQVNGVLEVGGTTMLSNQACAEVSVAAPAIVAATINIPVIPAPAGAGFASSGFASTRWSVNTSAGDDGVLLPVHGVPVGATITAVRMKLSDSAGATATLSLLSKEMPGLTAPIWATKASATSAGSGTIQLLQIAPGYVVPPFTEMELVVHGISVSPLNVYTAELDYQ